MNTAMFIGMFETLKRKRKIIVIVLIVLALIILPVLFRGQLKKLIEDVRGNKFDKNAGSIINQYVNQFYNSFSWYDDDEDMIFELAGKLDRNLFNKVDKAYKAQYGKSLEQQLTESLNVAELNKFYKLLGK